MKKIKNNFFKWFKRRFLAGVLALVPLLVTFWLAGFLYVKLTSWAVKLVQHFAPELHDLFWIQQAIRIATLLIIIIILLLVGEFMRYKLGRIFARLRSGYC
jgi:uncharacterized membrane protein